uniref:UMOD/GP2/OIT3-like D8C domain-containing protein n=1 Tax=Astyanax mexicanus TaxID=7994 RepID=A0A8B9HLB7_ASTMX
VLQHCRLIVICLSFDLPCYFFISQIIRVYSPWRSTTVGSWSNCDSNFNWNGWYRLLYYGMNIRMPESCTTYDRCSTSITFWLNGSHPQISDGIISRQACGSWTRGCCEFYVSIQVKACPGNYYVYEFINPNFCNAAYCAGTHLEKIIKSFLKL